LSKTAETIATDLAINEGRLLNEKDVNRILEHVVMDAYKAEFVTAADGTVNKKIADIIRHSQFG
jgi:hypothetical protein